MYPRTTIKGELVSCDELVGVKEHLLGHRVLFVQGVITGEAEFFAILLALDSISHDPIKMIIDSPGGNVDAAFEYHNIFNLIQSPVYTLGEICCSAAVILLASGEKGNRYLLPHSKVMMHLPSSQFRGDSKDFLIAGAQMKLYQDTLFEIFKSCGVKKTTEQILADLDREFWLEPQEAIDYGLADKIIDKETLASWLEKKEGVGFNI